MGNDRKFRALAIAAICVAVVGVSVAYAALQASLTITGTATVNTENAWKIEPSNLSCTAEGQATFAGTEEKTKTFAISTNNIAWDATFKAPGDKVTCTMKWTNGGSIDAAVTNLIKGIDGDAKAEFDYSIKIGSLELPSTFPITGTSYYLKAQTERTVSIEVVFDADRSLTDLSTVNGQTATFTAAFGFEQALADTTYTEFPTA